jgi:hypothetical protein
MNSYNDFRSTINSCNPSNTESFLCATDDPKFWRKIDPAVHPYIATERTKQYSYKYNSHGFRCDEFSSLSEFPILFLGCSMTSGVSLELQYTWPQLLIDNIRKHTNKTIPVWNLAVPGSSIDRQALLLEKYIHKLRPKLIFFLIPSMYRRLLVIKDEVVDYLPGRQGAHWRPPELDRRLEKMDLVCMDESYAAFESYKNLMIINSLASTHNSKIYFSPGFEGTIDGDIVAKLCDQLSCFNNLDISFQAIDTARDNWHPGPITHQQFANSIFEKIKDQL